MFFWATASPFTQPDAEQKPRRERPVKVTTEELDTRELLIKVELDKERLEKAMQKAAKRISRKMVIPGFRKGKAPYSAVVRYVGKKLIFEEAADELSRQILREIVQDLDIHPLGPASIEKVQEDPPMLVYKIPLQPLVDLGDYRSIRIEPEEIGEDELDGEVEAILRKIQMEQGVWKSVERPAQYDDLLVVDLQLNLKGKKFHQKGKNLYLDRDLELIPGLHDELVGLSAGEKKEFTLQGPPNDPSSKVDVSVVVHEVKELELPSIDDELAQSVGDYESLDELKQAIRERLRAELEEKANERFLKKALDALIAGATIKFPPILLKERVEEELERIEKNLKRRGLSLERYLELKDITYDEFRKELEANVKDELKLALVLREFIRQEGIEASPEEVEQAIKKLREEEKEGLSPEELKKRIREALLISKAFDRLRSIAKGELEDKEAETSTPENEGDEAEEKQRAGGEE
ncbi:MAG: trigger factor [Chloroflexi bacterium]|nr:MAG: trigger factor [Chloroflexota bacterium]HDN79632.1 trigger factor [Chloroflexota bacterium]